MLLRTVSFCCPPDMHIAVVSTECCCHIYWQQPVVAGSGSDSRKVRNFISCFLAPLHKTRCAHLSINSFSLPSLSLTQFSPHPMSDALGTPVLFVPFVNLWTRTIGVYTQRRVDCWWSRSLVLFVVRQFVAHATMTMEIKDCFAALNTPLQMMIPVWILLFKRDAVRRTLLSFLEMCRRARLQQRNLPKRILRLGKATNIPPRTY